jgi:hypothetical protein
MESDPSGLRVWGMGEPIQNPSLTYLIILEKGDHMLVNMVTINQLVEVGGKAARGESGLESQRGSLW